MWRIIYPNLVKYALVLVENETSENYHYTLELNYKLQTLLEYVLRDNQSLSNLLDEIHCILENKCSNATNIAMDWVILVLNKQPQSLLEKSNNILRALANMLPKLENDVVVM